MKNLAKKLTCGVVLSLLNGSLSACGVTSEVATTHPGAPSLAGPVAAAPVPTDATGPGHDRAPRPAGRGSVARGPVRPVAAASVVAPAASLRPSGGASAAAVVPAATAYDRRAMRTQSGRILDEAGQPLVGATVLLKGTTHGTSTDANGDYSLAVPLGVNTFVFAYSGYTDEVAQSPDGQPLTVTLLPEAGRPLAPIPEKTRKPRLARKRH